MPDDISRENFIRSVVEHCENLGQSIIPSQVESLVSHYASKIGDSCCYYHGIMALTLAASQLMREIGKDLDLNLSERKSDEKIMDQLDTVFAGLRKHRMSMIESAHLLLIATFVILHDVGKNVVTNCPPGGVFED